MKRQIWFACSAILLVSACEWYGCDWYGSHVQRRIGDRISLGEWEVEVRQLKWNNGIITKSTRDTWSVLSLVVYIEDGEPEDPRGSDRALCGDSWEYPEIGKGEARRAASALYDEEPPVEFCVSDDSDAMVITCRDSEEEVTVWLVLWANEDEVAYAPNVDAASCEAALAMAIAAGPG